jgi:hypothetical protein
VVCFSAGGVELVVSGSWFSRVPIRGSRSLRRCSVVELKLSQSTYAIREQWATLWLGGFMRDGKLSRVVLQTGVEDCVS